MTFADPVEDIPARIGIDRTESFAALSSAMGADSDEILQALEQEGVPAGTPAERLYIYLASREHLRFIAVAKKDWTKDVGLLRAMIEPDAKASEIVAAHIDEQGSWGAVTGFVRSIAGATKPELDMYQRLAEKQALIQKALGAKDWARTPEQAAQLLQINPFEARAWVSAEVNNAALNATHLLWDKYNPQYKVWLPFAAIGVAATIALGIFGQMAKRWKDMNA